MTDTFPVDYGPLDTICLKSNDVAQASLSPLMVLCRSPADDGWIAVEGETAVIYTLYDTIAYLYRKCGVNSKTDGLGTRAQQAALLARAEWYHHPTPPAEPRKRIGVKR